MKQFLFLCLVLCLSTCTQHKTGQQTHHTPIPVTQKTPVILQQKPMQSFLSAKQRNEKAVPVSYQIWLNQPIHYQQVLAYKVFFKANQLENIVPDFELFQSARDWKKCGAEEYEVPPKEIWGNIVPTLRILKQLVTDKILTDFTVTSVYRNHHLNQCAGGAASSRHVFNTALDFRIGSVEPTLQEQQLIQQTKAKLCRFWMTRGMDLNMGLGVYASGQIHIDTSGYRTWGPDHRTPSSPCAAST